MRKLVRGTTKKTRSARSSQKARSSSVISRSGRLPPESSVPTEPEDCWGPAGRFDYQRKICDLEMELSRVREELEDQRCKAALLESSRDYYATLYEGAPLAYVTLDDLGRAVEWNQAFERLVGFAEEGAEEVYLGRFLEHGHLARFLQYLHLARRSLCPVSCALTFKVRGGSLPVELISISENRHKMGGRRVRTIIVDATERMRSLEARAKTQSDFKAVVDTIHGVVWEVDPNAFDLTYVSPRAEQLLGYPPAYWSSGLKWESHVHPEDRERAVEAMRKVVTEGRDVTIEYRMLRADRRVIWVHTSMSAAVIDRRLRLFGVAIDITDRKEAEEQLHLTRDELEQRVQERTAQLRETVSDLEAFSYSLSHDLRAPLRSMQGYAHLLFNRLGPALDDSAKVYFQRLMTSAERLDRLIQDVLKFTQVSRAPVVLARVNLDELLDEVIHDYPVLLPPKVQIEVSRPLLPVQGHEAFLTQCLSNLLSNAVKFKRPGTKPAIKVSTQRSNRGTVRVWFEDNGIGISAEDQRRIFGIFERVHSTQNYEGTGIGLAIVAKAVERMGGHVGVESAVGQGSKFWLELPAAAA